MLFGSGPLSRCRDHRVLSMPAYEPLWNTCRPERWQDFPRKAPVYVFLLGIPLKLMADVLWALSFETFINSLTSGPFRLPLFQYYTFTVNSERFFAHGAPLFAPTNITIISIPGSDI